MTKAISALCLFFFISLSLSHRKWITFYILSHLPVLIKIKQVYEFIYKATSEGFLTFSHFVMDRAWECPPNLHNEPFKHTVLCNIQMRELELLLALLNLNYTEDNRFSVSCHFARIAYSTCFPNQNPMTKLCLFLEMNG